MASFLNPLEGFKGAVRRLPQGLVTAVLSFCLPHVGLGCSGKTDIPDVSKRPRRRAWAEAGQPWSCFVFPCLGNSSWSPASRLWWTLSALWDLSWDVAGSSRLAFEVISESALTDQHIQASSPQLPAPALSCSELMFQMDSAGKCLRRVSASCDVFLDLWAPVWGESLTMTWSLLHVGPFFLGP